MSEFGSIFLYILSGITLCLIMLFVAKLIRPSRPNVEKLSTYESGEEPEGTANIRFNVRFYVVALIFILFDVELVFLFPWATIFADKQLIAETNGLWGWFTFAEMLVFVAILALGLAYAWIKGHLDWVRPQVKTTPFENKIPMDLYEKINQKYLNR